MTKSLTAAAGILFILTAFIGCDNSGTTPKSSDKSIKSFSFTQALNSNLSTSQVDGVIDESGKTISVQVNGNALPNLIATFSMSAGAKVEVAGALQESGVTSNNFSNPVTYSVTAEDGSTGGLCGQCYIDRSRPGQSIIPSRNHECLCNRRNRHHFLGGSC